MQSFNIYRIMVCLVLLLMLKAMDAQESFFVKPKSTHLALISNADKNGIHLRWAPTDFSVWKVAGQNGWTLQRAVWQIDNYPLNAEKLDFVTLGNFKTLSLEEWETQLGVQDTVAAMAAQAYYGNEDTRAMKATSMSAAKQIEEQQAIRHAMGMLAADLSRNAAIGLGLYHFDESVSAGQNYIYRVIIENTGADLGADTATVVVSFTGEQFEVPEVVNVIQNEVHGAVQLHWPKAINSEIFTAFHVDRSTNNKDFQRVTRRPLSSAEGEDQADYYEFTDTDVEIGKKYYYRVLGITPFAELGKKANVIEATALDFQGPPPPKSIKISQNDASFTLDWSIPTEHITADFAGWIVKRSLVASGPFIPIHEGVLPLKQKSFEDYQAVPLVGNYYIVCSVDKSGNETPSFVRAAIWTDAIPPGAPMELFATVDTAGLVNIRWMENPEIDLLGYRVFVRDDINKEWYQMTDGPIFENSYTTTVDLKSLSKSIQYTVAALDFHYNVSDFATPYTLELPDLVAPVKPRWKEWNIENDHLMMEWYGSASDDVETQKLLIKQNEGAWIVLQDFPTNINSYSYPLESGTSYDFALVAVDGSSNASDTLFLKNITHTANIKVVGIRDVNIKENTKEEALELTWLYDGPSEVSFIIYRKALESDELEQVGTFDSTVQKILDKGPTAFRNGFSYYIQTILADGPHSDWSGPHKVTFKN
jgi:uncharacterized protein